MNKLLSAEFSRMLRNRLFLAELLVTAAASIWLCLINYSPKIQATDPLSIEQVFFTFHQMSGLLYAAFISLFLGTEYSDGVLRNKLIVGHKRTHIYLTNLLVVSCASLLVVLLQVAITLPLGHMLFTPFTISSSQVVYAVFCIGLIACVFSAITTAISMNCQNKAVAAVVSLLVMILLLYMGSFVVNRLAEPEMTYDGVTITMDGIQLGQEISNPAYISGHIRTVFEWLCDLLPTGQSIKLFGLDFSRAERWPFLSLGLYLVISLAGAICFSRKDIK